jgi:hypothetical protein
MEVLDSVPKFDETPGLTSLRGGKKHTHTHTKATKYYAINH